MKPSAGLGLKPAFFDAALLCTEQAMWYEVHAENYMVAGGPRRSWLQAIRSRFPISLHGVGLSLAGDEAPDAQHLERLAALAQRLDPVLVSEHLAWSTRSGAYLPDLLPFPRTHAALVRIADNVSRVQERLQRRIAIENPSHYLHLEGHDYDEIGFLVELVRRTGCGLLLDVNNVYVSANNLGFDAAKRIDAFPGDAVSEIHLAGHSRDPVLGERLLVDSHDAPVDEAVWALYRRLVERIGARPTLIERDANVPPFAQLVAERSIAQAILERLASKPEAPRDPHERPVSPCTPGTPERVSSTPVHSELERFENAFAGALLAPPDCEPADEAVRALASQPGFAVYRNTVMRALVDALRANYPSVARIVGENLFEALAACFARYAPPTRPCLADYGEDFVSFIDAAAPKRSMPFLADVARIDRLWTEAHLAADEPWLDAATVASIGPEDLMRVVLVPHAAARWAWSERHPACTIWRLSRNDADDADGGGGGTLPTPEGALLARPRDGVTCTALDRAACAFLDACADGRPLAHCAQAAFDADPATDLAKLLARLLGSGAFARLERLAETDRAFGIR